MNGLPVGFWGKLKRDGTGKVSEWHPLVDHCADVAACTKVLLEQPVLRNRIAATGCCNDLGTMEQERLCVLAALHDVGKFNIGFQNKTLSNPQLVAGHVREFICLFDVRQPQPAIRDSIISVLELEELSAWFGTSGDYPGIIRFLVAAVSHHGRPIAWNDIPNKRLWEAAGTISPVDGIAELMNAARRWLPAAFGKCDAPLPVAPQFQHAFSGLVMLADWLASDEKYFPFSKEGDSDRFSLSVINARVIGQRMFINPQAAVEALGTQVPGFSEVFGKEFVPRGTQVAVEMVPSPQPGQITIIEDETGAGKTEAAFRYFLRLFHARQVDGMYFALPTRTAATQIFTRIRNYVQAIFGENAPPVIQAVPGYFKVDEMVGVKLAPFEVLWNDDDKERLRYRSWAAEHPKRYLAGCIIVGTIDQILYSSLTVSHAHMRATALLRHLLIIDEVHASDPYMYRIMADVIFRHRSAGGHALLMSATLGSGMRERITGGGASCSLTNALLQPYPALWVHAPKGSAVRQSPGSGSQKEVSIQLLARIGDEMKIAQIALNAAQCGAKTVVIRNTFGGAVAVQQAMESIVSLDHRQLFKCNGKPAPHHSRFAREDRALLDTAIEAVYGKKRLPGGCCAIATQTVQQSLDLDADLLITDLCPVDVLLQRIGRLHRHRSRAPGERPPDYRVPKVIILVPEERDLSHLIGSQGEARGPHGIGTVYPDLRILEATWQSLENHAVITIPEMNRKLVETAMHRESIAGISRNPAHDTRQSAAWQRHSNHIEGIIYAQGQTAAINLVEWDRDFGEYSFGDLAKKIASRLGGADRIVDFGDEMPSPFGASFRRLTVPGHWAGGMGEDDGPTIVSVGTAGSIFKIGGREFVYDRLGLRLNADGDAAPDND